MSKIPEVCFKTDLVFQRFDECHSIMKSIASDMYQWTVQNKCPFMITESKTTKTEDDLLKRVSKTHQEGRAIDISYHGWTKENADKFIAYFSHKYASVAAIVSNGPKLIVFHDAGSGSHFHVQIMPGLSEINKSIL